MTKRTIIGCLTALILLPGMASAVVITFDGTISGDPYAEGGFVFSLSVGDHYGDATVGGAGTLNWHNGGANAVDVEVIMTHSSGSAFILTSFDLIGLGNLATDLTVLGVAYSTLGTHIINSGPISSLAFDLNPNGSISAALSAAIDNVDAHLVPEPGTLALLGLGLFGLGFSRQRKTV